MKIDLHVHSREVSPCGHLAVEELIPLYRNAGYDGFVLTNHFNRYAADTAREKGHPDFGAFYLETFRRASALGKQSGLLILCGYEVRFDGCSNDYLVFGMPDAMALNPERCFSSNPAEFGAIARKKGFLFYQAHPFRDGMTVVDPGNLFGMEVKNSHPRHDSRNDVALAWAEKYHLHQIGGSDCHRLQDVGGSGISTEERLENVDDLVRILRNDLYTIL